VAFEHGPLYALVDGTPPTVYSLNPYNGSITGSFTVPIPSGARGITYEAHAANWIWVSNRINRHVYRLTTAGSLASSFICPVGKPYALGYATHLPRHGAGLFAACREENQIVRFNVTTGSVLSSFEGPSTAIVTFDDFFAGDRFSNSLFWDYYGTWQVMDNLPARPLATSGFQKTVERKSVRVVARLAGATSAGAVVVGAAAVGFQNITWPDGLGVLWGVGQIVLLLAALGLGVVGFFTLLWS